MIPGPYRNLALIGFMGSGKTSTGRRLAERLGWEFCDADDEIVRGAGKAIGRIFAEDGEDAFRALEERVVGELLGRTNTVLALGGGAVASPLTRERLRDGSYAVLLDVSPQVAWRRVEAEAGDRPLAAEARDFQALYEQRRALYHATADALVDADQDSPATPCWCRSPAPPRSPSCRGWSAPAVPPWSPTGPSCGWWERRWSRS